MRKGYRCLFCFEISEIRESTSGEYRHEIEVITLAALGLDILLEVKLCSALSVNSFHDGQGVARGEVYPVVYTEQVGCWNKLA